MDYSYVTLYAGTENGYVLDPFLCEMLTKWQRKGLAVQGHYPPWRAIAWLIYHEHIYTNAPIYTCKIGGTPLTNSPYLHRVMVWLFF